jgi:hypothetical protein
VGYYRVVAVEGMLVVLLIGVSVGWIADLLPGWVAVLAMGAALPVLTIVLTLIEQPDEVDYKINELPTIVEPASEDVD